MLHRLIYGRTDYILMEKRDDRMDARKLGDFIAGCRKEKNMTQAELAVKINVTDKAVSRWERGGFP